MWLTWTATTRGQNAVQGYLQQAYIHLAYSLAKHPQTAVRACARCPYPVPAIPGSAPVPGSVRTAAASSALPVRGCVGPGSLAKLPAPGSLSRPGTSLDWSSPKTNGDRVRGEKCRACGRIHDKKSLSAYRNDAHGIM